MKGRSKRREPRPLDSRTHFEKDHQIRKMNFQAGTSRLCYTYDKLVHYAFASEGRGPHRSPPAVSSMRKMFLAQHSQFLMRLIRDPEEVVRRLCPSNQVTPRILQKAAASGVTSSDAEWAGAVAETKAQTIKGSSHCQSSRPSDYLRRPGRIGRRIRDQLPGEPKGRSRSLGLARTRRSRSAASVLVRRTSGRRASWRHYRRASRTRAPIWRRRALRGLLWRRS